MAGLRLGRVVLAGTVTLVSLVGISAFGVATSMAQSYPTPPDLPETPAATTPLDPDKLSVAVVAGATGTVAADLLGPYEFFARSPTFTVSPSPPPGRRSPCPAVSIWSLIAPSTSRACVPMSSSFRPSWSRRAIGRRRSGPGWRRKPRGALGSWGSVPARRCWPRPGFSMVGALPRIGR